MTEDLNVLDMEPTFANLTDMTLKRPEDVRAVSRDEDLQPRVVLNLLLIGLEGSRCSASLSRSSWPARRSFPGCRASRSTTARSSARC